IIAWSQAEIRLNSMRYDSLSDRSRVAARSRAADLSSQAVVKDATARTAKAGFALAFCAIHAVMSGPSTAEMHQAALARPKTAPRPIPAARAPSSPIGYASVAHTAQSGARASTKRMREIAVSLAIGITMRIP